MQNIRGVMTRQRLVLISILFFHSMNTYMDRACIASAKDGMIKDLNISVEVFGLALGIFSIGYALFQVPSGWIADRFGPRKALTVVVSFWSCFTMLTGAAFNAVSLLLTRFMFGLGEAGAFPGATRAFYRWLPAKERGMAQGINFSGSRLGAAISLFLMPWLIGAIGWRWTFVANGLVGIVWAVVWLTWFRDDPKQNRRINQAELDYINQDDSKQEASGVGLSFTEIFTSMNMSLAMFQYFASNVTFFISLTWLPSYLKDQWGGRAEYYSAIPLLLAAASNWVAGGLVTILYKKGFPVASRRLPAILGFVLGTAGLLLATRTTNLPLFVVWFSMAIFGVDMTLSPSWSFCMDIGKEKSGAVSGSMNMVGNFGAALSAILFPLFVKYVTIPVFAPEAGTANAFFVLAAALNGLAIVSWILMDPRRKRTRQLSQKAIRVRFAVMISVLVGVTVGSVMYKEFFMGKAKTPVVPDVNQVQPEKADANALYAAPVMSEGDNP